MTVIEVVFCRVDGRLFSRNLTLQRLQCRHVMERLCDLLMTLHDKGLCLPQLCLGRKKTSFGQRELRLQQ